LYPTAVERGSGFRAYEAISLLGDPALKILVDGRWQGAHGIGRFALEVIVRLQRRGTTLEKLMSFPLLHPLEPLWISWQIARRRPDVYFSPGFNPPLRSAVPFAFTIYDLIHLRFARDYGWRQRMYYGQVVRPALKRAAAVLTVSQFSRGEILDWSGIPEEEVQVTYPGVGGEFNPEVKRLHLPYPYFLYVGNRKPHKNVPRLLEAFSRAGLEPGVRLVLSGEPDRKTADLARALGLEKRVQFFGSVADEVLPGLYRGAVALVFPSLLEGFGLPPLEAMACGTPVIASNAASIPEVVGDAGILVDPHDAEDLADAMRRVLYDTELQENMSRKGLERARLFSWDTTARQVLEVLREAAGKERR
jgi:glycosyltransferase involved in cell wall biosynthesis